jgi:transposase
MTQYTIGMNISKARLDTHRLPDGEARQFGNNARGFRDQIGWIRAFEAERTVYKPTGAYPCRFEDVLAAAGMPLAKVNPLQARRFAEARGTRAKTDKIDAEVLAHMGWPCSLPCMHRHQECCTISRNYRLHGTL